MDFYNFSRERVLHVIDVENLSLTGAPTTIELREVAHSYDALGLSNDDDLVVVASNPHIAVAVGDTWHSARLLVGGGPSGADLQLLDVLEHEDVARRFGHVVVASGDGIFTEAVAALASVGVHVTVVARRGHLSRRLQLAAHQVIYLDPDVQHNVSAMRGVA